MCLVCSDVTIMRPGSFFAPHFCEPGRDALDRPVAFVAWSEVVSRCAAFVLCEQSLSQNQVTVQRIQHVLPRPYSVRPSNQSRPSGTETAHEIWNQPIFRPISPADDIASARRR